MFTSTTSVQAELSTRKMAAKATPANSTMLYLAYAAVYLIWGSTFFAIRIGIESMPALLLPALRHLSIGLAFYPTFRHLSKEKPTALQWRTAIVTGCLLLFMGNGMVSWAEKIVPSGIAALLVATVSLWMVLVDWLRPCGTRPVPRVLVGLLLGFAGLSLLVGPKSLGGSDRINPFGTLILVMASFAWAAGSVYSKHHSQPNSPLLGVAMQCIAGGIALLLAATLSGELRGFRWAQVTHRSWTALLYLAVFGSGVGFSAYVYLLKHSAPTRVGTYAFVNPVVALFLGWSLGGEPLTVRTILASATILAAVLLVLSAPHKDTVPAGETLPTPGEA